MHKIVLFLTLFGSLFAEEPSPLLKKAFLQLQHQVNLNKELSLKSEEHVEGKKERALLASYDQYPLDQFPLLVTTAVLEDGFGDYVQLKNVLNLLQELKWKDVKVLVFYADIHKDKIPLHPLPPSFTYHFVEFQRTPSQCILKGEHATSILQPKDFNEAVANHPLFLEYKQGDRELMVVAAFFSKAFGILKAQKDKHPLFLREITPFLKNGMQQDIFVLGWAPNQAMYVNPELLQLKAMTKKQRQLLAQSQLPERLLRVLCDGKCPSESNLNDYFSTHTLHHAYFHHPASNSAFIQIILKGLSTDTSHHDFFLKNLQPLFQATSSSLLEQHQIATIEFHFLDGTVKKITSSKPAQRTLRLIETEFLSSSAFALLSSLISPPYMEGCTGDNSSHQALLLEHIPLIEHTHSKDYPRQNEVDTHSCQNSACLYQALSQLKPYPETLAQLFYLSDLLMFTLRNNNPSQEIDLLTEMMGHLLQKSSYLDELKLFSHFIQNERDLKPYFTQILKRQATLLRR